MLPEYQAESQFSDTFASLLSRLIVSSSQFNDHLEAVRNFALDRLKFLDIGAEQAGISRYQSIYDSLTNVLESSTKPRLCKWFCLLESILRGALLAVDGIVKMGQTVLVHCSDGWDRTAQIVCLAQLMLDAKSRTLEGFATLIEKDWRSTGHQFAKRAGHGVDTDETQRAPIFIQVNILQFEHKLFFTKVFFFHAP